MYSTRLGEATYMGAMASALSIQSSLAAAKKQTTLLDAYGAVAAAMGFADWASMKKEIASKDDPVVLSEWTSRGPRVPTVDGSINKKVLLGDPFADPTPTKICLKTDDVYDIVAWLSKRIESYTVLEPSLKNKMYWLLSAILRPLVHLRNTEGLPLAFATVRRLLALDEYLVFATEILDSDLRHQYANAVMWYGVTGSPFADHKDSVAVSVEEHCLLAEIIADVTTVLEIEAKFEMGGLNDIAVNIQQYKRHRSSIK
jgi:hypothetical protein